MIKENLNLMNNTTFITNNRFAVNISNENVDFKPYEIDYFIEKENKRLVLNIRYTLENIENISKMVKMKHCLLPTSFIKLSEKFNINFSLLDPQMETRCNTLYSNCVLRKIAYPKFYYTNKLSQKLLTIECEFKYETKTEKFFEIIPKELTNEEKQKINTIIDNGNRLLEEALNKAKNHYKSETNEEYKKVKTLIHKAKKSNQKKRFNDVETNV